LTFKLAGAVIIGVGIAYLYGLVLGGIGLAWAW
jgi:hypothetical protein